MKTSAPVLESPPMTDITYDFLKHFFLDYLNRFDAFPMRFHMRRNGVAFSGLTKNENLIYMHGNAYDLGPLLKDWGVPSYTTIGGDFVMACDYSTFNHRIKGLQDRIGLCVMDTSNHGYDAFFLAGHLRGILLNVVDAHLRKHRRICKDLFDELNDMMRGPITQDLVKNTNPSRARGTKGAVGIYGNYRPKSHDFRFVDAGLPLFYYSAANKRFYALFAQMAPPLGYFGSHEKHARSYEIHRVALLPGDALILASDGLFDVEHNEKQALTQPQLPIQEYRFETKSDQDDLFFNSDMLAYTHLKTCNDPGINTFLGILEPYLRREFIDDEVVSQVISHVRNTGYFHPDDCSMIVIQRHG